VTLVNQEAVDTSGLELFGLDEYIGLKPIDLPLSYTGILRNIYCRGLGLPQERLHMPDWRTNYPMRTSQFFEREIMKANGIDLQMLGLGVNGHVGFNEPPARQGSLTHVERLSQLTRERNLRSVMAAPERAITQGIATIRRAKALLMLAYGQDKAIAANNMLFEPASPMCPASLLLPHADLTLMVDLETASLFPKPYFELGEYNLELPLS
jgi:glucosamine-6-phosphate deaminase